MENLHNADRNERRNNSDKKTFSANKDKRHLVIEESQVVSSKDFTNKCSNNTETQTARCVDKFDVKYEDENTLINIKTKLNGKYLKDNDINDPFIEANDENGYVRLNTSNISRSLPNIQIWHRKICECPENLKKQSHETDHKKPTSEVPSIASNLTKVTDKVSSSKTPTSFKSPSSDETKLADIITDEIDDEPEVETNEEILAKPPSITSLDASEIISPKIATVDEKVASKKSVACASSYNEGMSDVMKQENYETQASKGIAKLNYEHFMISPPSPPDSVTSYPKL